MLWGLVKTIFVLPGTALVPTPATIVEVAMETKYSPAPADPGQLPFWLGLTAAALGLGLGVWTVTLFMKFGKGTLTP